MWAEVWAARPQSRGGVAEGLPGGGLRGLSLSHAVHFLAPARKTLIPLNDERPPWAPPVTCALYMFNASRPTWEVIQLVYVYVRMLIKSVDSVWCLSVWRHSCRFHSYSLPMAEFSTLSFRELIRSIPWSLLRKSYFVIPGVFRKTCFCVRNSLAMSIRIREVKTL